MIPTAALAENTPGRSIQINNGMGSIAKGDLIYYGDDEHYNNTADSATRGAIGWRVLDPKKTNTDTDGVLMVSENPIETGGWPVSIAFEKDVERNYTEDKTYRVEDGAVTTILGNTYQGSDVQSWCKDFAGETGDNKSAFADKERRALISTTKNDSDYTAVNDTNEVCILGESSLNNDRVFLLSVQEVEEYLATKNERILGNNCTWWTRSPLESRLDMNGEKEQVTLGYYSSYYTSGELYTGTNSGYSGPTPRPACNLDLNSVLFTSAADGKVSGAVGAAALTPSIPDSDNHNWKLTLKDADRNGFSAGVNMESTPVYTAGCSVDIDYRGAKTDADKEEYVSAALSDANGNILYYGNIVRTDTPDKAAGSATVKLPESLEAGNYALNLFSEQCHGDYKTDYASDFSTIAIVVKANVKVTAGANMTKTEASGAATQKDINGAITDIVYTANENYYFPEDYITGIPGLTDGAQDGITVNRDSDRQITIKGVPTAENVEITLPAATATAVAPVPAETPQEALTADDTKNTGTSPVTGDTSSALLWLPVLLASGGAVMGTFYYKKRRKMNK